MHFSGPRPVCLALDGLMDEIGDPAVELIKSLGLEPKVEEETIARLNEIIMAPSSPSGSTGLKIRQHIYDMYREMKTL